MKESVREIKKRTRKKLEAKTGRKQPGVNFTALPGYVKPTKASIQKAKDALGIPASVKLPRCQAKAVGKVNKFEKAGDYSHSAKDHLCDECRCGFRAGHGTAHLGYGFCITHENSMKYAGVAEEVKNAQLIAVQQGYTDETNWEYAVADPDGYVAKIRAAAEDAGGMMDLREDITIARHEIQKILKSYKRGSFKKRVKIVEGSGRDKVERWELVECDDVEKVDSLTKCLRVVGKLSIDNLKITDEEVISKEQLIMFGKAVLSLAERLLDNDDVFKNEFVPGFAQEFKNVKAGRSK